MSMHDHPVAPDAVPAYTPSRRADGWSPDRQSEFLDLLARGHTVADACRAIGLTHQSAYRFRQRAAGAAFALGWEAALLLQRQKLADTLTARAFDGQTETITRADGSVVERHRYDNRLALALLSRLDRLAAAAPEQDRHGEARAARLAAQDWEAYLDLVAADRGPAGAGLFLATRACVETDADAATEALSPLVALARADLRQRTGASDAGELADDLDPAQRHGWSAADWARAEGLGLVQLAPPPPPPAPAPQPADPVPERSDGNPHLPQLSREGPSEEEPVWWDEMEGEWLTHFPPPADFAGTHYPAYPQGYARTLAPHEAAMVAALDDLQEGAEMRAQEAARDGCFAAIAAALAATAADGNTPPCPLDG